MIKESTLIILHKKLDVYDMGGEKVMADFETGNYYMLKGAANDIWDHLQSDVTVGELKEKLMEVFEVDEKTCMQNLISFLEQLNENGFIQLA